MMTLCIVVEDVASCVERWFRKGVNGEEARLGSLQSRVGQSEVGINLICADEGRRRRLLRSNS
jgi:hypothetical protein